MAGEEEAELRDLVAQSLEAKGVLGKIRAQLRASVFLALEEQESQEKPHPFVSEKLSNFRKTREGRQAVALVREFLEFFQLDFTTAVFDPETNAHEDYPGRDQLAREVGVDPQADTPLLSSLLIRPQPHLPSHSFAASLHAPSHPLPSHAASFPTSLSPTHHHTSSSHHHHITNGNSLLPLTLGSAHSLSDTTTTNITMATSAITTATTSITTTTTSGKETLKSTSFLSKSLGTDGTPSEVASSSQLGRVEREKDPQRELDDFFGNLSSAPLSSLPPPPPLTQPSRVESSESSISDLEESIGSGKTTDVTQAELSLHGDYDYQTDIVTKEQ